MEIRVVDTGRIAPVVDHIFPTAPDASRQVSQSTAPVLTPPPSPPQQVSDEIIAALRSSTPGTVELRLDPPELGRIQVHIANGEGAQIATVTVEREETLDLLRRNEVLLRRDLVEAGLGNTDLNFARQDRQDRTALVPPFHADGTDDGPVPVLLPSPTGLDRRI
ncbi:MAG: flagellar hook-length control protein FliK [Pseudomonadota bacterium]